MVWNPGLFPVSRRGDTVFSFTNSFLKNNNQVEKKKKFIMFSVSLPFDVLVLGSIHSYPGIHVVPRQQMGHVC